MNNKVKAGDLSEAELWNDKNAIYTRMEELRSMTRNEKALNLMEECNESVNTTKRLMERYRQLETDKFYQNKSENGEVSVDCRMLNEANEVAINSDKRWRDLGFIYKK